MCKCKNQRGSWKESVRKQVRYTSRLKDFLPLKNCPVFFFKWYLLLLSVLFISAWYYCSLSYNINVVIQKSIISDKSIFLSFSLHPHPRPQSKSWRQVWTNFSIPPLAADCSISDPPPSPGCFKGKILLSSVKIIRNIGGGGQLCLDIITLHQKKLSSSSMREKSASS